MKLIPTEGLWGETALREAAAGSFQHIMRLIEAQLREAMKLGGDKDVWPYVVALFTDNVVVNAKGKLVRYDYTVTGDTAVTLSNPVEVVEDFRAINATMQEAVQGIFLEAGDAKAGTKWRIRVIRAGLSANRNFYPDAVLREAVDLFEKARVFVKADKEHLAGGGKDVRNLIGRITSAAFVEGKAPDSGEIHADLELMGDANGIATKLREAWDRKMADTFGFSIDAAGKARTAKVGGRSVRAATAITKVNSVDLIVEPGAGGEVLQLLEAADEDGDMKLRERMLKLIEAKLPEKFAKLDKEDDERIEALYREAVAADAGGDGGNQAGGEGDDAAMTRDDVEKMIRVTEARAAGLALINASKLPEVSKDRLRSLHAGDSTFNEAMAEEAIKAEATYLANFTESGRVVDLGDVEHIGSGETRPEKIEKMLEAFFDPGNREVISFKECYIEITGDKRVTGRARDCDKVRLREALDSASFSDVLGDSITRRMIADYRTQTVYDIWRQLGTVVPVSDFRTQERTRWGGYGDLPIVAQSGPYTALTSPTDEAANYAVAKRGGVETVTLEMIKNDDAGAIQRIPMKMSRAAKRTLSKFVLDFPRTNPVIYDGLALFHATHGNLGAAALDATSLAAGRLAIKTQQEFGAGGDQIGVPPKYLWVPDALEETAVDLFRRNTENDKTFVQSLTLDVMPVWYWTDVNDWVLSTDPLDVPTIEIGFLDGQEEPEVFVQDNPTVGSLFSNDQITYKIRHIYGGNVLDYRGFYKAVVV